MPSLLPTLLNAYQQYGYPLLWGSIVVAALGDFNLLLLFVLALSAFVCGDTIGYGIGRRWGSTLLHGLAHTKRLPLLSPSTVARSRVSFKRWGGWAVFLSRFPFSAVGSSINVLAGTERFPYRHFLVADIAGEALGATVPLILGYSFAASWKAVGALVGAVSLGALTLFVVLFLLFRLGKMAQRLRAAMIRQEKRATKPTHLCQLIKYAGTCTENAREPWNSNIDSHMNQIVSSRSDKQKED